MTKQSKKPITSVETKPAKEVKTTPEATAEVAPKITKKALVDQLLKSDKGATIEELAKQTGWQAHTVRGHLSILKNQAQKLSANILMGCGVIRLAINQFNSPTKDTWLLFTFR